MFTALANLTQSHRLAVVIASAVLFAAAGVLGSGVADRLDPYGAEDPDTESVIAEDALTEAGHAETGVIVLVEGTDPTSAAGERRVARITREVRRDDDVEGVTGYAETGSRAFLFATATRPTSRSA